MLETLRELGAVKSNRSPDYHYYDLCVVKQRTFEDASHGKTIHGEYYEDRPSRMDPQNCIKSSGYYM